MDLAEIFKELIWDVIVQFALKELFIAIPFLAWGPLGIFVGFIVSTFADWLFKALKDYINFELIVIKKEELAKEYATQAYSLKMIAEAKGIDSDEFKAQRELAKTALSRLIHFGGE